MENVNSDQAKKDKFFPFSRVFSRAIRGSPSAVLGLRFRISLDSLIFSRTTLFPPGMISSPLSLPLPRAPSAYLSPRPERKLNLSGDAQKERGELQARVCDGLEIHIFYLLFSKRSRQKSRPAGSVFQEAAEGKKVCRHTCYFGMFCYKVEI